MALTALRAAAFIAALSSAYHLGNALASAICRTYAKEN